MCDALLVSALMPSSLRAGIVANSWTIVWKSLWRVVHWVVVAQVLEGRFSDFRRLTSLPAAARGGPCCCRGVAAPAQLRSCKCCTTQMHDAASTFVAQAIVRSRPLAFGP